MKKYIAAGLCAAVLCGVSVPVSAVDVGAQALPEDQTASRTVSLRFETLEKTVRENNVSIKAYESAVKSAEQTNVHNNFMQDYLTIGGQIEAYQAQIKNLEDTIARLGEEEAALKRTLQVQLQTLRGSLEAARQAYDALDDKEDQAKEDQEKTVDRTKREMQNAADRICRDAEQNYIAITALQFERNAAERELAQLDRNIAALKKQAEMGMIGQNELKKAQSQREMLLANRKTIETKYENLSNTLAIQCGYHIGAELRTAALPHVTEESLAALRYNEDLKTTQENSYAIWSKQDAADKAADDYKNGVTANKHAHEAAKIALDAEKENVTVSFRKLYKDVQEKQTAFAASRADLRHAQKTFEVERIKYQRGMISGLAFADAQDALAAAEELTASAEIELLTSYQNYQWAKRGLMVGTAQNQA